MMGEEGRWREKEKEGKGKGTIQAGTEAIMLLTEKVALINVKWEGEELMRG
jgi:hypothetical protein